MHDFVLWMQRALIPLLGPPGMFVVAFFDSSFLSIPEVNDIFVVTEASARPGGVWAYVLATTLGSVAGCSALWWVGKRGGEPLLVRRFGPERVEQTRRAFRRWDLLALAVPALLPPPMPFKIFVFSSGVFGVPFRRFVLAIAFARGARYTTWAILGAAYGPRAIAYLKAFDAWFARYDLVILPVVVALFLVGVFVALRRRPASAPPA
jgi:membrane protein YqaA with SNARE-associated domain